MSSLRETGFYAFFTAVGGVSVGWPGSEQRGFQHKVFNKADRRLRATLPRLSVSKRGLRANIGCHWDRENPDITFFNLEFFFVWSINAFKSREPADETTAAISCCPWGILCSACSLPFITWCSLKGDDIPTNMRPGGVDPIEFGAFFWLQWLEYVDESGLAEMGKPEQNRSLSEGTVTKYRFHVRNIDFMSVILRVKSLWLWDKLNWTGNWTQQCPVNICLDWIDTLLYWVASDLFKTSLSIPLSQQESGHTIPGPEQEKQNGGGRGLRWLTFTKNSV